MEEEISTLKAKLKDLDQKLPCLYLQHSTMRNRLQSESSANTGLSSSSNFRGSKLDFPRFNGDDPTRWIYKAGQYFNLHRTFVVNKVPLASFHLEQEALQWYRWYIKPHEEPKWPDFFQLLLQRFGPSAFDDFIGSLTKLHQIGTVKEYQTEFEKLANHTEGLASFSNSV